MENMENITDVEDVVPNYQQRMINNQGSNIIERLVHNYYIDFMVNIKKDYDFLFSNSIHSYEFNYGSKTLHQHKLYKDLDKEYPKCSININSIDQMDNIHFRDNGLIGDSQKYYNLAENYTKEEIIACTFRWVNINYSINITFENGADVLNYSDMLIQRYPLNLTYYNSKYKAFVDINKYTNWEKEDNTSNVYYKLNHTDNKTHMLCNYELDPRYKITNISKKIDNTQMKFSIKIDYDAELKIPHIMKIANPIGIIKSIEVVLNTFDTFENNLEDYNTFNDLVIK